jgi:hypothetical protein
MFCFLEFMSKDRPALGTGRLNTNESGSGGRPSGEEIGAVEFRLSRFSLRQRR